MQGESGGSTGSESGGCRNGDFKVRCPRLGADMINNDREEGSMAKEKTMRWIAFRVAGVATVLALSSLALVASPAAAALKGTTTVVTATTPAFTGAPIVFTATVTHTRVDADRHGDVQHRGQLIPPLPAVTVATRSPCRRAATRPVHHQRRSVRRRFALRGHRDVLGRQRLRHQHRNTVRGRQGGTHDDFGHLWRTNPTSRASRSCSPPPWHQSLPRPASRRVRSPSRSLVPVDRSPATAGATP